VAVEPGGIGRLAVEWRELIAVASPPCHVCGDPVQRVEVRWHRDRDGEWWPGPWLMVCAVGHRVPVRVFEEVR
jgi:hypothetical protein